MLDFIGLEIISKGGPLMIALFICSVLALAMIVERLIVLRRSRILRVDLLVEMEIAIKNKDYKSALSWCEKANTSMTRLAKVALINSHKPSDELKESLEAAGRKEVPILERYFTALYTISVITPLLGLLGTVMGMIHVFDTIVSEGGGDTSLLAGGISEALITTASGLTIAIPVLIFYNFFTRKVDNLLVDMEHHSLVLHELITSEK